MSSRTDHPKKHVLNTKFITFISVVLCFSLMAMLPGCPFSVQDSLPPDLSDCTHLDVLYLPSTLNYFFGGQDVDNLLRPAEKKYIQSLEYFTVTDTKRIKAFAHDISQGTLYGIQHGTPDYLNPVQVVCYRNGEHIISFTIYGNTIATDSKSIFKYPIGLPNLDIIEPPEMRQFRLRSDCAWNIKRLYTAGPLYRRDVESYPEANQWCDAIMQDRDSTPYVSDKKMRETFKCPSAGKGECHYAMNPNCEPNSPSDMVLLFETKAGWNQHGGPGLFTFDNHDPPGGCVLLNDGTVKFIRTKEELQKLRWK